MRTMKNSILVVDDDLGTRSFLKYVLQRDYEVVVCEDGSEAVGWLEEGNFPDIIISDVDMPRFNGLDLVRFIRSSGFFCDIPIIILSGFNDDNIRKEAYKEGVDLYLLKPFGPTKLIEQILTMLNKKNHAQLYKCQEQFEPTQR